MFPLMESNQEMKNGWHELKKVRGLPFVDGTIEWQKKKLRVFFSPRELHPETDLGGGYWKHLSISHPKRYPFWDEILDARYTFFDDNDTVYQLLPPKTEYVNLMQTCFHLWSPTK